MNAIIHSIDGNVLLPVSELKAGVGTNWTDLYPIPVTLDGHSFGIIDPSTGTWHRHDISPRAVREWEEGRDTQAPVRD